MVLFQVATVCRYRILMTFVQKILIIFCHFLIACSCNQLATIIIISSLSVDIVIIKIKFSASISL